MNPSIKLTEKISRFIHFSDIMTLELRENMVGIVFEYFYNPDFDGLTAITASEISKSHRAFSDTLASIFKENTFRPASVNNVQFALKITEEILGWLEKKYNEIQSREEVDEQQAQLDDFQENQEELSEEDWHDLTNSLTELYPEMKQTWDFYDKKLREIFNALLDETPETDNDERNEAVLRELKAVKRNISEEWKQALNKKKESLLKKEMKKEFSDFLAEKNEFFLDLDRYNQRLSKIFGHLGRFWDLSGGRWQNIEWNEFEKYARILEQQKGLQELAEILGRYQKVEKEYDEAVLEKSVIKDNWKAKAIGKSEIAGVHFSDDLSSLLPCEVALLSSPETEIIFSKKFVEKKLLTFSYQTKKQEAVHERQLDKKAKSKVDAKGPVIACVDTSASMHGTPEKIAKTIVFALLKTALRQNRKCYLISFSTKIETLELSDLSVSVPKLVNFLKMSFRGGTDLSPALVKALKMLRHDDYRKADVVVISDFVIPSLPDDLQARIEKFRRKNMTRFHSLVITEQYNPRLLEIFDNNWIYDVSDPNAIKELRQPSKNLQRGRIHC